MMRCSQVEKRLAEYTDGLLGARDRERIEAHLAECEACQVAVADMLAATDVLRALPPIRPPATFAPRVRAAVRAQAPRALVPPLLRPELRAVLSGAFLTVALGLLVTRSLAPPRVYVPSGTMVAVATEDAAPAVDAPKPVATRAEAPRPDRRAPVAVRRGARTARAAFGSARSMSALNGPRPSRERLTPKPAETPVEKPAAPAVGRASIRLAAMAEVSTGPRLSEEASDARLVSVPEADRPGAALGADGGSAGVAAASLKGEADGMLTLDVLFNDRSVSPYAET